MLFYSNGNFRSKKFYQNSSIIFNKTFFIYCEKKYVFFCKLFFGIFFCNFRFFRKLLAFLFFENIFFRIFCPPLRVIIAFEKFLKKHKISKTNSIYNMCVIVQKVRFFWVLFGYFLWDFLWEECVEIFEISFFLVDLADPRNLDIFQFQNDTHILGPRYLPGLGRR